MTEKEREIFVDAYGFLKCFSDVPGKPTLTNESDEYWLAATEELCRLSGKHNHPLMNKLLLGTFEYLEQKDKAKRENI